ncbi:MAG: M15 family metallopeptidase [Dokdonella sp.]
MIAARVSAWAIACAALVAACASSPRVPVLSSATTPAAAGLIDIRTLLPDIVEDIRYAGRDNFVGTPIDGYLAPRCYLLRPAAEALQHVELALRRDHLRLKIWDCYRPVRAVRQFVRWANDTSDQRTKATHYPNLDKRALLGDYIAPVSGHSRGATVDLTLLQCLGPEHACIPLDMGTDFDFFDPLAHTDSPRATPAQHANRVRLRAAMMEQGFANYAQEWWHYTLSAEPTPQTIHDAPVQ